MRMNISVPDDLAEEVRNLDLSISGICQTALRAAVDNVKMGAAERITVQTGDEYNITEGFVGRWLVEPDDRKTRTAEPNYDAGAYWGVALTQKGRIAVYTAHCNEGFPGSLDDFDTLADADGDLPEDIYAMAASALGQDYVIMRDI